MDASAKTSTNRKQGTSSPAAVAASHWTADPLKIAPGLILTIAIAATAFALRAIPGFSLASPMILAIAIGIAINAFVGTPVLIRAGIVFVLRRILRLAIILLGLQLTAGQIFAVGASGRVIRSNSPAPDGSAASKGRARDPCWKLHCRRLE